MIDGFFAFANMSPFTDILSRLFPTAPNHSAEFAVEGLLLQRRDTHSPHRVPDHKCVREMCRLDLNLEKHPSIEIFPAARALGGVDVC